MNVLTFSFYLSLTAASLALASCGRQSLRASAAKTTSIAVGHSDASLSAAKLREYCKACHAVGEMRFIWTESDDDLWRYIFTNNVPNKNRLWADAIYEVLSWPSDAPPAPFPVMDPPNGRDWMPKGSKRIGFAADSVDGVPVRNIILQALSAESP